MLDNELAIFAFNLQYCQNLAREIPDEKLSDPIAPGMNPPRWILGHLAIATDFAAGCLGLPKACPVEWHREFGPGSTPDESPPTRLLKSDLLNAITAGHDRVAAAAPLADPAAMAKPHGAAILKDTPINTVGELLAHLMTSHFATHLGQLSVWRRAKGLPPLF